MFLTNHEIQNDEKKGENARVDGLAKYGSVSISIFSPNEPTIERRQHWNFVLGCPRGKEMGRCKGYHASARVTSCLSLSGGVILIAQSSQKGKLRCLLLRGLQLSCLRDKGLRETDSIGEVEKCARLDIINGSPIMNDLPS